MLKTLLYYLPQVIYTVVDINNQMTVAKEQNISKKKMGDFAQKFSQRVLDIMDVKVNYDGLENIIQGPAIICSNHVSEFEILGIANLPGKHYFTTKKELFNLPFLGSAMRKYEMPLIDRSNREQSIKSMNKALVEIKKEGAYLIVFAEGTRNQKPHYHMKNFKKGAFWSSIQHDIPIMPIATYGGIEIHRKGSCKIIPGNISLRILPSLYPTDYEGDEAKKVKSILHDTQYSIKKGIENLIHEHRKLKS